MGTSLINTKPQDTYPGLIKTTDNAAISATLKTLSDGNGNDFPMQISTTAVNFTGTLTQNGSPVTTPPSGVSGAIQFSNGSAFASDAANLFWDDTNNRLGVGTNAPSATAHFKGSGTTSGTTALLVQNSAGTSALTVKDDLTINFTIKDSTLAPLTFGSTNGRFAISPFSSTIGVLLQSTNLSGGLYQPMTFWGSNMFMQTDGSLLVANSTQLGNATSAKIEIQSTTQGFLTSRMTTTQKNAIATPAAGLVVYDNTTNKLCCYNGSTWNDLF